LVQAWVDQENGSTWDRTLPGAAIRPLSLAVALREHLNRIRGDQVEAWLRVVDPDDPNDPVFSYDSITPLGTPIALDEIDPSIETGTLVQVEGLVRSIILKDDLSPPKFSSFFVLEDTTTSARPRA